MRLRNMIPALAFAALALTAAAQPSGYPNKPIKLIVGFPAGGASDVAARAVGQKIAERLGQPVVIDNRPGAASNIGSEIVAKSAPDGYTVLLGTISLSINPSLYPKLTYDPLKDFVPVTQISSAPFLLVVNPNTPYRNLNDLLAAAKSAPQPLLYASAGNGSGAHLFMEYFAMSAGVKLAHVPYKGAAPAMNDVLSGEVPLTFDNIITTLPLAKVGRLRPLAVSTKTRSAAALDIPTLSELGVTGFDATSWFGLFVPAGTPPEIVKKLHDETIEALKDPQVRERLLAVGSEPVGSTPAEFARFFRAEVDKWGKVVRAAKVQID
jgi:tripartite-type tricarboxylate transporter receptor subunit TctC